MDKKNIMALFRLMPFLFPGAVPAGGMALFVGRTAIPPRKGGGAL